MKQWPELKVVLERFDQFGWLLGTSGNFSLREGDRFFLSRSGVRKGEMTEQDFVALAVEGPWPPQKSAHPPSAEGSLHQVIYQAYPVMTCVVHAHTPAATLAGLKAQAQPEGLVFSDIEMLKGLEGIDPLLPFHFPVFTNHPVVEHIATELRTHLAGGVAPPVVLLAGHGVTAWGKTVDAACRHFEIAEFLCRLAGC